MNNKLELIESIRKIICEYSKFGVVTIICVSPCMLEIVDNRSKEVQFNNPLILDDVIVTSLYQLKDNEYQIQVISKFEEIICLP